MQKYTEGSAVDIIKGKHKGKRGYIDRYDVLDSTYLTSKGEILLPHRRRWEMKAYR